MMVHPRLNEASNGKRNCFKEIAFSFLGDSVTVW